MNRLDPLADPPALTETDLETGLLDLALRGFIPQTADLTPAMERGTLEWENTEGLAGGKVDIG